MSSAIRYRPYLLESKYELLKALRLPVFAIPALTFPVFFYVLFGLSFTPPGGGGGGMRMATYLLASYGAFGVMGAALFNFGVGVAIERGQGWLLLKRATPMPPSAYFLAKIVTAMAFGAACLAMMSALGVLFGEVRLEPAAWLGLFGVVIAGALPFCAFGLLLGLVLGPNSAPPMVNLIYLPSAFASGMWIPIQVLPRFFKAIAPALPSYHLAQLALAQIGASQGGSLAGHAAYLAGFSAVCLALARVAYLREDGRTFG
jgi:ABC-2 type transport system permease protein